MGDPSLSMWTDTPVIMSAVHPATLAIGARSVAVTVRRADDILRFPMRSSSSRKRGALDSTWVRGRHHAQGQIVLPVTVRQPGGMFLTITKRNHKPYLVTMP